MGNVNLVEQKSMEFGNLIKEILTISDKILIIIVLILILCSSSMYFQKNNNNIVEIKFKNKIYGTYDLKKNQIISVTDEIIVEIKDNKVRIKKSNCKNQICVKQGWSNMAPLICVPNQLAVSIKQDDKDEMLITY